ncbi:hypothetical protein RN001_011241 [Aquatica leii]|uniref:Acid phosphatase n=1 Tax=Aquatica leii TaxID=1421715 RepID=A0AAN7Q3X9_9COLE|nr:hypothetical protein RN001_011241 [Aquatica leii]
MWYGYFVFALLALPNLSLCAVAEHHDHGKDEHGHHKHDEHHHSNRELKLVHIIYRHGIRTPADTYPKDIYINNTWYPTGWGQITERGQVNLYKHGMYLRERYDHFLGDQYTPDLFYVQTTDADRTKVTAQCINAGLWPVAKTHGKVHLPIVPIPPHSEPLNTDSLLLVRRPCPQYHLEIDRLFNTSEIKQKLNDQKDLYQKLEEHTGKKIGNFEDVQDIFTTLMSEETVGVELPAWTKEFYPEKMYEPMVFSYVLNAYNDKLNRLKGGVLLKKMIDDWKNVAAGTISPKGRKAFLYIGHDSTIVNILSTVKVWEPQIPGFAINTFFELSYDKDQNKYGVEIFLRNSTDPDFKPHKLKIPNCDFFCPLDKLIELTKPVVPVNWDAECLTDDENYTVPPLKGP